MWLFVYQSKKKKKKGSAITVDVLQLKFNSLIGLVLDVNEFIFFVYCFCDSCGRGRVFFLVSLGSLLWRICYDKIFTYQKNKIKWFRSGCALSLDRFKAHLFFITMVV